MCYEFSLWSRKLRSEEQVGKQQPQKSEPVAKQPAPAPQAPVTVETKVQKRETIPA